MKGSGERQLADLISVGPAIRRDLERLGVTSVAELALRDPERLYRELCRKTGKRQDPCVLDVFRAAVAQASNPNLPIEQCVWWYWSRKRKEGARLPASYGSPFASRGRSLGMRTTNPVPKPSSAEASSKRKMVKPVAGRPRA